MVPPEDESPPNPEDGATREEDGRDVGGPASHDDAPIEEVTVPSAPAPEAPPPLRLHCLGGAEAPFDTSFDLREVRLLPPGAQKHLWRVLGPSLSEPIPDGVGRKLEAFAKEHQIPRERLARAIRACRFVLRAATMRDLPLDLFLQDVSGLLGTAESNVHLVLASGYERAKSAILHENLAGALGDHGKILLGVDWRVDTVNVSQRGAGVQSRVAFLTLRYLEGDTRGRVTVQALPDVVRQLRSICDVVLDG